MGNGPAYDHMYEEMDRNARSQANDRRKRFDILQNMNQTVGIEARSSDLDLIDRQINHHLMLAYELLSLKVQLDRRRK